MANIVLTRIDDRLIHGQVMTAWVKQTKATRIIIIDDVVAKDDFMKKVLTMAAPPGIKVEVYNVYEASDNLKKQSLPHENLILLVKIPQTVDRLIDNGIDIKNVVLGGMGASPSRKKFYKNISVSEDEREAFKRLINKGVKVNIRIVPDDKSVDINKFI